MAEILGLGCTHWPTLCLPNERLTDVFNRVLDAPNVDPKDKDPANWPSALLAELGNDNGLGDRRGRDNDRLHDPRQCGFRFALEFAQYFILSGDCRAGDWRGGDCRHHRIGRFFDGDRLNLMDEVSRPQHRAARAQAFAPSFGRLGAAPTRRLARSLASFQ